MSWLCRGCGKEIMEDNESLCGDCKIEATGGGTPPPPGGKVMDPMSKALLKEGLNLLHQPLVSHTLRQRHSPQSSPKYTGSSVPGNFKKRPKRKKGGK